MNVVEAKNKIESLLGEHNMAFSFNNVCALDRPGCTTRFAYLVDPTSKMRIVVWCLLHKSGRYRWEIHVGRLSNILHYTFYTSGSFRKEDTVVYKYTNLDKMLKKLGSLLKDIPTTRYHEKLMLSVLVAEAKKVFVNVDVDDENNVVCRDDDNQHKTNLLIMPDIRGIRWQAYNERKGEFNGSPRFMLESMKRFINENGYLSIRKGIKVPQ